MVPTDPRSTQKMNTKAEKILKSREVERKSSEPACASRGQELKWEIPEEKGWRFEEALSNG
jgi:hypothetical protein